MSQFENITITERTLKRFTPRINPLPVNRRNLPINTNIKVLVDVSGSTNNSYSRSGCRNFRGKESEESDLIIVMELLGVIDILRQLETRYHLEDVMCDVIVFSSKAKKVLTSPIGDVDVFGKDIIMNVLENFDGGSTNLHEGLLLALESSRNELEKIILIVATDGQANTDGDMSTILSNINQNIYCNNQTLTNLVGFVVGAGSIQLDEGTGRYFRTRRNDIGESRFDVDNQTYDSISELVRRVSSTGHSECNLEYLLSFMGALGNAVYAASCRDLSLLNESVVRFLDDNKDLFTQSTDRNIITKKWRVDLNGWLDLPSEVSDRLNKHGAVIAYVPPTRSWYCYVGNKATGDGWQVALIAISTVNNVDYYIPDAPFYTKLDFRKAWSLSGESKIPTITGEKFTVAVDDYSQWRCRKLTAI